MADGEWTLKLLPDCPGWVRDLADIYFSAIRIYATRVPVSIIPSQTAPWPWTLQPLYTGLILERPDAYTVQGPGLSWYLGQQSSDVSQVYGTLPPSSGYGMGGTPPYQQPAPNAPATLAATVTAWQSGGYSGPPVVPPNIGNGVTIGLVASTPALAFQFNADMLPRGWIVAACANWNVEWRLNHNNSLDLGPALWGTNIRAVAATNMSGRDPNITALNDAVLTRAGSRVGIVSAVRAHARVGPGADYTVSGTTIPSVSINNQQLYQMINIVDDSMTSNTGAQAQAQAALNQQPSLLDTFTVSCKEFALTDLVPCGSWIGIYDPDQNIYDTTNPVAFRGATIWPMKVRLMAVDWQIRQGLGVYLDNRHNGGQIVDISDYVAWETGDDQLTVGYIPHVLKLQRNLKR